ncbi:unnamed protein product [Prorocentrum cordatum]|uniref:Uncharacterized protein n=1 Tax=Prorocentrum cordatum TaxID=2364126 RepID=A0ABN9XRE6_9DINO|nr:unnamed protein product [Polarella glacialis]
MASARSEHLGLAAAAPDVWQQWPGCTFELKATFLHLVDQVEERWRRERLPRARSAPPALGGARAKPVVECSRRTTRSQRRRRQRVAGKKQRRGEALAGGVNWPL